MLTRCRKEVGKAFMRAMSDALGNPPVFEELQKDNYWCVALTAIANDC
jgi:hypothetical protein